jgi:serine/threonine protein kinase HipA of HipAB toxin-antitoxin module
MASCWVAGVSIARRTHSSTPLLGSNRPRIARLPQEDFCQALGFSSRQRYERDGGRGMARCLRLLTGSADPRQDMLAFQLTQLTFWPMAATDGHAKNYSIFLQPGDTYVMTPLYDILSVWGAMWAWSSRQPCAIRLDHAKLNFKSASVVINVISSSGEGLSPRRR